MTARDFAFIAAVIDKYPSHAPSLRVARTSFAHAFARALQGSNPKFNPGRFIEMCNLTKGAPNG